MAAGIPKAELLIDAAHSLAVNYNTAQQQHGKKYWLYAASGTDESRQNDIRFIQFVALKVSEQARLASTDTNDSDAKGARELAKEESSKLPRRKGVSLRYELFKQFEQQQKKPSDTSEKSSTKKSLGDIAKENFKLFSETKENSTPPLAVTKAKQSNIQIVNHQDSQAIIAGIFACFAEQINQSRSALYKQCISALGGEIPQPKELLRCYSALQTFLTENATPKGNKVMLKEAKNIQIWLVTRTQKLKQELEVTRTPTLSK